MEKMREILFRGKRSDGEWAFGSLLKVTFDGTTYNLIFADNFLFVLGQAKAMEHAAVIPETVGQFTGLTDKNGTKIFEGDILQFMAYGTVYTGKVEFLNGAFWVKCRFHDRIGAIVYEYKPEIIGNIYDNPEL